MTSHDYSREIRRNHENSRTGIKGTCPTFFQLERVISIAKRVAVVDYCKKAGEANVIGGPRCSSASLRDIYAMQTAERFSYVGGKTSCFVFTMI